MQKKQEQNKPTREQVNYGQRYWVENDSPFFSNDKYTGWKMKLRFSFDKYDGEGTYIWANGEKYVGNWKDDKRSGQGTYTWANGTKYVGAFVEGKRNEQGTYTRANDDQKSSINIPGEELISIPDDDQKSLISIPDEELISIPGEDQKSLISIPGEDQKSLISIPDDKKKEMVNKDPQSIKMIRSSKEIYKKL